MDEIISALSCIPVRDCSYAEWLGIGMALKDAGYECAVWDEWSRDDKRYIEGDCARRWATFKGAERPVTVRTIRAMARKNGWISAFTDFEETQELAPCEMLIRYLETLFQPDDLVGFATQVKPDKNGKLKPINTNLALKAADFIDRLRHAADIGDVIGPYRADCGAWIRMNPLDKIPLEPLLFRVPVFCIRLCALFCATQLRLLQSSKAIFCLRPSSRYIPKGSPRHF